MSKTKVVHQYTQREWIARNFEMEYTTLWLAVEEIEHGHNFAGKYVIDAFHRYKHRGMNLRRNERWCD